MVKVQAPAVKTVIAIIGAFLMAALLPGASVAQGGSWSTRTPMPTSRIGASAATINGTIYVVGGVGTAGTCGSRLGTLEAYDPVADSWNPRAPMPTPRSDPAAVTVDGKLYVIGGDNICLGMLSTVEAYDPATDSWTTKAPMPTPRSGLAAAVVDGVVYAIGGVNFTSGWLPIVEAYDPGKDSWSIKAPMPIARGGLAVEVVGGIIYAVGGATATAQLSTVEAYDPKTDSWTERAPMPTPRCCFAMGKLAGTLYAAGGGTGDHSIPTVESYNPASNAWSSAPPMPTARATSAGAVAHDTLFVIGGVSFPVPGFTILAVNEAFTPFEMVSIDIKPGDRSNTINPTSRGVVPVAILGSATFDPMTVDPTTVTLAGAPVASRGRGVPAGAGGLMTGQSDVNNDGYPDLLLYFRTQDMTALQPSANPESPSVDGPGGPTPNPQSQRVAEAVLYGTTYSGQRIRGSDTVRIVPASQGPPGGASPRSAPRSGPQTGSPRGPSGAAAARFPSR